MSTVTDQKPSIIKKEGSDVTKDKDDIFQQWKGRKESINPNPALKPVDTGAGGQRRSNMRDNTAGIGPLKGLAGIRRMTLTMRAKSDVSAVDLIKPQVKKENTYKMAPDEGMGFSTAKIKKVVTTLLEDELDDLCYDHDIVSKLACELSDKIKDKVKELSFPRHKIAVNVMVGQAADQGMEVVSRCVWDHKADSSVAVTFRNKDLFVIALIFGVYFE